MNARKVLGSSTEDFYNATVDCLNDIENASMPQLLECMTQRWKDHVGVGDARDLNYRDESEIDEAMKNDDLLNLEKKLPVIICGDLNVAHREIDLARPKQNIKNPGFSPEEREGFNKIIASGFIDTFREFETGEDFYSWWSFEPKKKDEFVFYDQNYTKFKL